MSRLPLPFVDVAGTPAECGAGYGAAAADMIRANLDRYRQRFAEVAGIDGTAVRTAGAAFDQATRAAHPRIAAMLDGVAEGAGVPAAEIYALNARTELLFGQPAPGGGGRRPGRPPALDGLDGGCTAVGVLGSHTAGGHVLIGQNWDWYTGQRDGMVLLRTRDERGHTVLTLAEAGMLAKTGLNSAGLGVCVNLLGCDRDGYAPPREPGIPYHVVLRAALEAPTLSRALRAVVPGPRNASINMLLGQPGPAGGEVIDLELVPGDSAWLHPSGGVLTHANHFESGLAVYDTIKDWGGSSLFRSARARRLLAEAAADRKITEDDLMAVFRDHASQPQGICRHPDPQDTPLERSETVYSVVLDLDDRRFGLAAGPPCRHEFTWLELTPSIQPA